LVADINLPWLSFGLKRSVERISRCGPRPGCARIKPFAISLHGSPLPQRTKNYRQDQAGPRARSQGK
jgi:hypothetical protein